MIGRLGFWYAAGTFLPGSLSVCKGASSRSASPQACAPAAGTQATEKRNSRCGPTFPQHTRRLIIAVAVLAVLTPVCCLGQTIREVFTSTRSVTGIVAAPDGTIVASTRGGILVRTGGAWRKYTMLDGLPTNEMLGVFAWDGRIVAVSAGRCSRMQDDRWVADEGAKTPPRLVEGQICSARWKGTDCAATPEGLRVRGSDGKWRPVGMPPSTGTHISALLDRGSALWAAVFGDGVFSWDGKAWIPVKLDLPAEAREITAMAAAGDSLWIGTRREGLWEHDGHAWRQHLQPNEPWDHNCQALAWYGGSLYASTLDEGLVVKGPDGWRHARTPEISNDTPRQMVEFAGSLYLRQSVGVVDRFDGKSWTKNVFASLPRKQCSALAADGERLYVGQWGGWSEFDGKAWTHRLDLPELQGCQVTALLPDGDTLWIGTQGRGIAQVDRASGRITWHDERTRLPDDTIKCIVRRGDTLWAGTFSRGVAWIADGAERWAIAKALASSQVTEIVPGITGGCLVGARTGLWQVTADGRAECLVKRLEVQALLLVGEDLWVGTRTGILRLGQVSAPAR